jgi:hypothetical protein
MPASPWTTVRDLDPDHGYVVMATRFEVTSRRHLLGVMGRTQDLWRSLPTTDGLVGHRFASSPLRGTLSTLTAWRDRASLDAFVRGPVHTSLVTGTRQLLAASAFVAWESPGADLPPTWAAADERLDATRPLSVNGGHHGRIGPVGTPSPGAFSGAARREASGSRPRSRT